MTHGSFRFRRAASGQTTRWICWKHHNWNGLCWVCSWGNELISGGHSWICLSINGVCACLYGCFTMCASPKGPREDKRLPREDIIDGFWRANKNLGPTEHAGTRPGGCLIICWNFSVGMVPEAQSKSINVWLVWARLLSFLQEWDSS